MFTVLRNPESEVGEKGTHGGVTFVSGRAASYRALVHLGCDHASPDAEHDGEFLTLLGREHAAVHDDAARVVVVAFQPRARAPRIRVEVIPALAVQARDVTRRLHEGGRTGFLVGFEYPSGVPGYDEHLFHVVSHVPMVLEGFEDGETFLPVRPGGNLIGTVCRATNPEGHDLPVRREFTPHDRARDGSGVIVRPGVHNPVVFPVGRDGGRGFGEPGPVHIQLPAVGLHEFVKLPVILTRQKFRRDDRVVRQHYLLSHGIELLLCQLDAAVNDMSSLLDGVAGHRVQSHVVKRQHRVIQRTEIQSVMSDVLFRGIADSCHQCAELHRVILLLLL